MTSEFNSQVTVDKIPDVNDLAYTSLETKYLKVRLFYTGLSNLIFILIFAAYFIFKPFEAPQYVLYIIASVLLIRLFLSFLFTIKGFAFKAYAVREKDIVYKSGWLWRSLITVPFNRVQHLQVDQGPLERKLQLSKLKIFTAGGQSSDLTIPGLRPETARKIKQFIVSKTAVDEEE